MSEEMLKGYELGLQRAAEEARHVSRGYVAYQAMACLEVADRIDQIPRNPADDVCTRHDGADKPLIEAWNTRADPALAAAQAEVARWQTAAQQAVALIDEINERKSSRAHYGIEQGLHGKLCSIRATLARAALVQP